MSRIVRKQHRFDTIVQRKSGVNMQNKHKKKSRKHDLKVKVRRLKGEVEEMRKEQSNIREGQSQVREKLKAIETEWEALHEESKVMIQKSGRTQIRLALMFNILRAREEGDLVKAAQFTHLLREIIAKDNMR
ncbi:hypothetical protein V6N13_067092 [Hibiscus sabdariffa]|uniref:Uncharacterized protein n=1 Tax=Hibiscus sabdariffa TaxID=183260 RepID=A0ABR2DSD6_9ROSI